MNALLNYFFSLEKQRKRLLAKAPEGPLKQFLSIPFVSEDQSIVETQLLALDFETTGLNAKTDKLLSVGYVTVDQGLIKLGQSEHQVVRSNGALCKDNVVIHQITDDEMANGEPLSEVVEKLLQALAGKVMLVHFAKVEKSFLQQACLELYGMAPVFPIIDTLVVAKRRLDMRDTPYDPSELRLVNLRDHYHLPSHWQHNALNDAVATAELLMAQLQHNYQGLKTPLKSVLI